jgi:hypothetical protein
MKTATTALCATGNINNSQPPVNRRAVAVLSVRGWLLSIHFGNLGGLDSLGGPGELAAEVNGTDSLPFEARRDLFPSL